MLDDEAAGALDRRVRIIIMKCSCRVQWNGGMRSNELGLSSGWEGAGEMAAAHLQEGLAMISTSFRVALSALFFAGALGLASTGAARAESVMKECGDEWKAAKANNTTNGMTWQEFLKQCRTQKEAATTPASAPAVAPAPAAAPAPAPAPAPSYQPKPVPAQTAARPIGA